MTTDQSQATQATQATQQRDNPTARSGPPITPPGTPPRTPPRPPPRSPPPRGRRSPPAAEQCPESPMEVQPAPIARDASDDELYDFGPSDDDTEAERGRQAERRKLRFRRLDDQENRPQRLDRGDPAKQKGAPGPPCSPARPRARLPALDSLTRTGRPEEPPDDFHTPAASADEGSASDGFAAPRERPEKKPIPPASTESTPRRSGRARQPPLWYTPSPQR